jgi:DNA-binding CsgD family transcriptional regulator
LNHVAISILDERLELVFCNNKFSDKFNEQGEMVGIIHRLCNELESSGERHIESRIEFNNGSCFVEISKCVTNNSKNHRFVAIIYDVPNMMLQSLAQIKSKHKLTEREFEVSKLVLGGLTNEEIGLKLCISLPTVKKHLTSAYEKLGINRRSQLIDILN